MLETPKHSVATLPKFAEKENLWLECSLACRKVPNTRSKNISKTAVSKATNQKHTKKNKQRKVGSTSKQRLFGGSNQNDSDPNMIRSGETLSINPSLPVIPPEVNGVSIGMFLGACCHTSNPVEGVWKGNHHL